MNTITKNSTTQHHYLLSDEEIMVGDWYINISIPDKRYHIPYQCSQEDVDSGINTDRQVWKVIATTDNNLGVLDYTKLIQNS